MSRVLMGAALILCASVAVAAPARVEMVQPPASVDDGSERRALEPGAVLGSGDALHVGEEGRLRLRLAEGSAVKVGSSAHVRLTELQVNVAADDQTGGDPAEAESAPDEGDSASRQGGEAVVTETADPGLVEGLLEILGGAFRFTTDPAAADRKRDIDFKVGPVTTGIRGTDIWGKAAADRDFVVLLEGAVDVSVGPQRGRLTEPGTAVVAPGDARPQIGVAIDRETIQRFARETEPVEGQGRLVVDGPWRVMLDSVRERASARRAMQRYRAAGYPAEIIPARVGDERWYRIAVSDVATRAGAAALGERFEREFGVEGAWVQRRD